MKYGLKYFFSLGIHCFQKLNRALAEEEGNDLF